MDTGQVAAVGSTFEALARRAASVAEGLERLVVPEAGDEVSIGAAATAFLGVWRDSTRAMATELHLLDERCVTSASSVVVENDAARRHFVDAHDPAVRGRRTA